MLSGNCLGLFLSSDFLCAGFILKQVEKMTTIIPRLIFYQLSRKEYHILKVPIIWLASHDPITMAWAQTTLIGTRGQMSDGGVSSHLLGPEVVTKPIENGGKTGGKLGFQVPIS